MQVKTFLFKNKINSAQLGFSLFCPEWKRPRFKIAVTRCQYPWSFIRSRVIYFLFFCKARHRNVSSRYFCFERSIQASVCFEHNIHTVFTWNVFFQEEYRNSMPASSFQQQKLRVCEVCSAYLGLHDNDRRLADHFGGKLHLGFIQIREKLDQLKVCLSLSDLTLIVASSLKF